MKVKKGLVILLFFLSFISFAQKGQRVGYIDMNYILENVPEYVDAQSKLDDKVKKWQQKLDDLSKEIETQKIDLSNEKSLLTKELINEYEEDILIKENELKRLQNAYFGPKGDLFQLRNQLAKPVQDQVYNAVQEIAVRKKFDFVLDKSSDLILLYSNNKFDISEQVLNSIVKGRKRKELDTKKKERMSKAAGVSSISNVESENVTIDSVESTISESEIDLDEEGKTAEQKKIDDRVAKREALKAKIKAQQEFRNRRRDSLKKVADDERAAKLKEIEDRKNNNESNIENRD